jgi:hypothetical protein
MRASILAWGLLALAGCGACEPDRKTPPASTSASVSAAPPPATTSHAPRSAPPPKLACRIVTLDGEARAEKGGGPGDAGTPMLLQGLAPVDTWIDVAKGSRLVARDPHTARETTFRGPARARACVGFAEESWIASGHFESSVGAGEQPGSEEWVVTPFGAVRYTAAKLSVDVGAHDADVSLEAGQAFAWGAPGDSAASDEGWTRLTGGKTKLSLRDDAVAAVDKCAGLARSARTLAAQVMAGDGGADGATIARQVTTRRLARAACAVASLRANALAPGDAVSLLHPLAEANATWNALP